MKSNEEISIIRADASHFKEIYVVEAACFSDPWSEQSIFDTLSLPEYVYFAAVNANGETVGYVAMYRALDEGHIVNVAVHPEYRRTGIADKLISKLTEHGLFECSPNISVFYLEVRESNSAAINLYRKHGFKEYGIRKNYYRFPTENAVLMLYDYLDSADSV